MIKILFLIPTLDKGGAENILLNLVNSMDQSEFDITVQTLFDENSQKQELKTGIHYRSWLYHQFHGNSRILAYIPSKWLYRLIVKKRYDIIVSFLEGPTTHIVDGCPYADSKKIAWIHTAGNTSRIYQSGFRSIALAQKAYLNMDCIVCVAKTVEEAFKNVFNGKINNTRVLYNVIDSQSIILQAQEPIGSGITHEDRVDIITVGRIIPVKGYDRLLKALGRIKKDYPKNKFHLCIVGKGVQQQVLEQMSQLQDIRDEVSFLGFQENPYKFVAKSDFFVCSSRREGFSSAVTEALILGIPVLSTDCSGAYELLGKNNEYGLVVENSEEGIYQGIVTMLLNSSYKQYSEKAKERGELFSAKNTTREIEKMFFEVIDE